MSKKIFVIIAVVVVFAVSGSLIYAHWGRHSNGGHNNGYYNNNDNSGHYNGDRGNGHGHGQRY